MGKINKLFQARKVPAITITVMINELNAARIGDRYVSTIYMAIATSTSKTNSYPTVQAGLCLMVSFKMPEIILACTSTPG